MEILGAPRRWTQANPDSEEQDRTDLAVREALRPLLALCAAVQGCAAVYYGPSVSGLDTVGLALSAATTGALCVLVWRRWSHWPEYPAGYVIGGVFAALLMHSLLRVAYDPSYGQPGELALILVAGGATLCSMHWLAIAAAASLITWCAIAIPTLNAATWIPGLLLLVAASGVSLILLQTRVRLHAEESKNESKTLRWMRRLQAALDAASEPIALLDTSGRIRACNEAWRGAPILFPDGEKVASPGTDFFQACRKAADRHNPDAAQLARGIRQVAQGHRDTYAQVCRIAEGEVEVVASRREIAPGGFGLTLLQNRRQSPPPSLTDNRQIIDLLLKVSRESVWDWDLEQKQMSLSSDWHEMLGYADGELTSDPDEWLARINTRDLQSFMAALSDHLEGRTELFEAEHRIRNRAGAYRRVIARGIATRDADGRAVRIAGTVQAHREPTPRIEPDRTSVLKPGLAELSAGSRSR